MSLFLALTTGVLAVDVLAVALCKAAHRADAELDNDFASRRMRVRR
jgi:hypothetical protein